MIFCIGIDVNSLFDRWHFLSLGAKVFIIVVPLVVGLVLVLAFHLATDQKDVREIRCLALNIYHEARGEPEEGQLAVATVTMNRVASPRFPDNVCDVVRQYGWNPRLQKHISAFSWTGDKLDNAPSDEKAWQNAVSLAREVLDGKRHPALSKALFYHAKRIKPSWAKRKKALAKIGAHIFY